MANPEIIVEEEKEPVTRFMSPREIMTGTPSGFREMEIQLIPDQPPGLVRYRPAPTKSILRIQEIPGDEGKTEEEITQQNSRRAILVSELIGECLVDEKGDRLMTKEEAMEMPYDILESLMDVVTGVPSKDRREKKVLEIVQETESSTD